LSVKARGLSQIQVIGPDDWRAQFAQILAWRVASSRVAHFKPQRTNATKTGGTQQQHS